MLNSPRCWVDCWGPRKPFPYLHLPVKKYGRCQIYLLYWLTLLSRVTVARWVSESMRPFHIVKDRGLRWLCKTGRPHFYLPDETTIAKDVKYLYSWSERQLAEELQVNLFIHTPCIDLLISRDRATRDSLCTSSIAGPHPITMPL